MVLLDVRSSVCLLRGQKLTAAAIFRDQPPSSLSPDSIRALREGWYWLSMNARRKAVNSFKQPLETYSRDGVFSCGY